MTANSPDALFIAALETFPDGYGEGFLDGRRWGATIKRSDDGKRLWLYAEELGGGDFVSCNAYLLKDGGWRLKPCEMPEEKVVRFVSGYKPVGAV